MIEYGSMNSSQAFCEAKIAGSLPEAPESTFDCTIPASWPATTIRKVQPARRLMCRSPTPRHWKSGRRVSPARRQKNISTAVCTTIPPVAVAARTAIIEGVHASTRTCCPPKSRMNAPKPAIDTMLLTIGAPRVRTEDATGVEDLAEQGVETVEEDLRQAPVGECGGEGQLIVGELARVHVHQEWCGDHRESGGPEQAHRAEGEQLRDERLSPVRVRGGLHDLRDDDGGQQAGRDDRVDVVRQLVGDGEGVTRAADRPDGGHEHDGAQHPADARHDGPGPDEHTGPSDAAHGVSPARCPKGSRGGVLVGQGIVGVLGGAAPVGIRILHADPIHGLVVIGDRGRRLLGAQPATARDRADDPEAQEAHDEGDDDDDADVLPLRAHLDVDRLG